MFVSGENLNFKRLLLLDDFTGSGATLNKLAGKIKKQKIADEVIGLTITGSVNGFEIIKEI
jgi:predicted amidophosphoribosyltransferase